MPPNAESMDFVLPKRRALPERPAGADVLLRDPSGGGVHFLSPTAAVVWECCDGRTTTAQCVARLRGAFAVPEGVDLAADVLETVKDFQRRGLLEEDAPDAK